MALFEENTYSEEVFDSWLKKQITTQPCYFSSGEFAALVKENPERIWAAFKQQDDPAFIGTLKNAREIGRRLFFNSTTFVYTERQWQL